MTKCSHFALLWLALGAGCLAVVGCTPSTTAIPPPPVRMNAPGPGMTLKPIMMQIGGNSPNSLWSKINSELNMDPPPWDDLKPQTEKFSTLAANVGSFPPPKGQETWADDAKNFAALTDTLKSAVADNNLAKAKETQNKVHDACDSCHRAHRGMPGG